MINKSEISDIVQLDGADTLVSDNSQGNSDESEDASNYDTDDELNCNQSQINLFPIPGQNSCTRVPLKFDVNTDDDASSSLPLCIMTNARSIYNKQDNLAEMLHQLSPIFTIISEAWEREKFRINKLIDSKYFKTFSYFRKNQSRGGG